MKRIFASVMAVSICFAMPLCGQAETTSEEDGNNQTITAGEVKPVLSSPQYQFKTGYVKPYEGVHLRKKATKKSKSLKVLKYNKKIKYANYSKKWSIVKVGKKTWYVKTKYISKKKGKKYKVKTKAKYSARYFRRMGVIRWNGWRWTWYSQRVLAGGGLKIPGRHVDEHGYICDKDDYICVAISTLKKCTVIKTPFGKEGKVYDCGCSNSTIDIYVNW